MATETIINGQKCPAEVGETLMEVARRNGAHIGFVCDGKGYCSTCECKILDGAENLNEPTKIEQQWVNPKRLNNGYRLACQTRIEAEGNIITYTRAEILKRQFVASFSPDKGESHLKNTSDFFYTLSQITVQHLEQFPSNVVNTFQQIGAVSFFFPWRNLGKFAEDTGRVINGQFDGSPAPTTKPPAKPYITLESVEENPVRVKVAEKPAKPFDFLPIEDIGPVFNQRLYEGGVYSYTQLAAMSPEEIAKIVEVSPERIIRNQWREQAAQFAAEGK
jgi:ferredoxin/predicted flap endonuclease-1-like 5' DNA nuclease